MVRKTRMYLPGIPVHVVQRGNNRAACFLRDEDYHYYKELLGEGLRRYGGELHAYCLMTNHVHLLLTPRHEDSIACILQHLGRQYVRYVGSITGIYLARGLRKTSCTKFSEEFKRIIR